MAKQLVHPIERHVEKAVLGLTGLALVAVIALYLVTSPNQTELGQEKVSPSTIDGKVAQKATDVIARLHSAQPGGRIPPPLFDEFTGTLQPLARTPFPTAVAIGPEVPIVDAAGATPGQAGLVKVNRPAKPTTTHGRGTITESVGGQPRQVPVDWVTVSALFEVKAQAELQRLEYGAKYDEVEFAPPEVQRRARRLDGSWSDEDWKDVKCWPAAAVPPAPGITLFGAGGKMLADKDELKALDKFADDLQHPKMQLDVLRPMPPEMVRPTRWALPVITSYRDVLKQDDEYVNPAEQPAADPADRYGVSGEAVKKKETAELSPAEQRIRNLQEGQKLLESAKQNKSENEAIKAGNIAVEILADRTAGPNEKDKATKLKAEAEQVQNDIKRWALMGGGPAVPAGGQQGGQPVKKRERLHTQQMWAHDAGIGSIVNGESYQYRLRFRIYSRLAGLPEKFNKPEDAAIVLIAGEWSDPSDPVWIEPSTRFFVTSDNKKDEEIGVEFFQWFGGVWVKPERRVKGTVGALLRDKQRVPTPAIDDPNKVDRPEVEFVADATPVDIDFDRAFRERKAGATTKGVKFAPPASSCSVVFVDSRGRLQERFESLDKAHPDKKDMTGRLWVQPRPK